MHTNGLGSKTLNISAGALRNALSRVADPNKIGMGMVLNARGNVYGDEGTVPAGEKQARRRRNKAARQARAMHRRVAKR